MINVSSGSRGRLLREGWRKNAWKVWSPATDPLPTEFDPNIVISFCTTCMGRNHDLKRTLIPNLENNPEANTEFIILNYNSKDDMHDFITSTLVRPYLEIKKVRYFRTREPLYYSFPHSRNLAFRQSSGDVILNLDPDNYTGPGFANRIRQLCAVRSSLALFARAKLRINGRLGLYRQDFYDIGGYDESLTGYGYDDRSLLLRALSHGCTLMWWGGKQGKQFSNRILTPRQDIGKYLEDPDWPSTETRNYQITLDRLARGEIRVNQGRQWGCVKDLEEWHPG